MEYISSVLVRVRKEEIPREVIIADELGSIAEYVQAKVDFLTNNKALFTLIGHKNLERDVLLKLYLTGHQEKNKARK